MAKPAFIYAFDNFDPFRFTELCGLLLASRYKGFLLGGVGPDGGIDGELDEGLGVWEPESISPLENMIIEPGQAIVFQFKHVVVGRIGGQIKARQKILSLFKSSRRQKSELQKNLIKKREPLGYILITNVEVNSEFREKFIKQCQKENSIIKYYQIIGLDELETWITMEKHIRHLYFPTIFEMPRFNLKVKFSFGFAPSPNGTDTIKIIMVSVLNIGMLASYIKSIIFKINADGVIKDFVILDDRNEISRRYNPKSLIATPLFYWLKTSG